MGDKAEENKNKITFDEDQPEETPEGEEAVAVADEPTEEESGEQKPEGDGQPAEDDQEVEIVFDEGSTQTTEGGTPEWVQKRFQRYSKKVGEARQETDDTKSALELERQRNHLLQLKLDSQAQTEQPLEIPDPEKFDGGVHDRDYIKQLNAYNQQYIRQEISRSNAETAKQVTQTTDQKSSQERHEKNLMEHWGYAGKLKIKDYDKLEDKATEILGPELSAEIIDEFTDEAHKLFAFLGTEKNEGQAYRLLNALKSNPKRGTAEIGRLLEKIKFRPKTANPTPDPDQEIEGAVPSSGNAMQKRVDKLRKQAQDGNQKALSKIMEIRKAARDKGITLE